MLNKRTFTEQIARKIKEFRLSKKLSQEELADQAELYRTYIGHLENGRYSASGYVLYKIAQALKVSSKELLPF